jgi:hypothetical protein
MRGRVGPSSATYRALLRTSLPRLRWGIIRKAAMLQSTKIVFASGIERLQTDLVTCRLGGLSVSQAEARG